MKQLFSIILMLVSLNLSAQIISDESYLDLSFLKFKAELLNCVIAKDTTRLKIYLAEHVFESKDGCAYPGCTKEDLIKYYFRENADDSWALMLSIVRFGFRRIEDAYPVNIGTHDRVVFQAPSYLTAIDPVSELVILGENVNIRKAPSLKSEVLRISSFEVFKCDCSVLSMTDKTFQTSDGLDWLQVKLGENEVGYVASELTSYAISREMTVAKVKGAWKIISWFQSPGC